MMAYLLECVWGGVGRVMCVNFSVYMNFGRGEALLLFVSDQTLPSAFRMGWY